jgi:hypothetical protein
MATEFRLSYTAEDINMRLGKINSLAEKSELPKNTSDLINDSNFVTKDYVQDYAQPYGDYALNANVIKVKQEAISESNAYTDEQIESALVYVDNADIEALF